MNKGIVIGGGVAAVVVAALAGGPAFIGGKVQGEVEGAYARVFQQLPFIRVVEQTYAKGWMSATHTATMRSVVRSQPARMARAAASRSAFP